MSESDTDLPETEEEYLDQVRSDDGVVIGDRRFFVEGSGSAIRYKAEDGEGEVENITKSVAVDAWKEARGEETKDDEADEDEGPEEVHLGTFYFSKSNWDEEQDRETLEDILAAADWEIVGEVSSGGYKIQTER